MHYNSLQWSSPIGLVINWHKLRSQRYISLVYFSSEWVVMVRLFVKGKIYPHQVKNIFNLIHLGTTATSTTLKHGSNFGKRKRNGRVNKQVFAQGSALSLLFLCFSATRLHMLFYYNLYYILHYVRINCMLICYTLFDSIMFLYYILLLYIL